MRPPLILLSLGLAASINLKAADHAEAPGVKQDPAADINDVYAFTSGEQDEAKLNLILTFDPLKISGEQLNIDQDVKYSFNIDSNGDAVEDHSITARFGQSYNGRWGIYVDGFEFRKKEFVVGPVGRVLHRSHRIRIYSGINDDPFFFDLEGFLETVDTGSVSMRSDRDSFAATNVGIIAVQLPLKFVSPNNEKLNIWATTSRTDQKNYERRRDFFFSSALDNSYNRVDRMGMPAVATALISKTNKDNYNFANPKDDLGAPFINDFISALSFFHTNLDDDLSSLGLSPCKVSNCLSAAAPVVLPDTLKLDPSQPSGFPNGRKLDDAVIDVVLGLALLDLTVHPVNLLATVPLNPPKNDKEFSARFPYVADPH